MFNQLLLLFLNYARYKRGAAYDAAAEQIKARQYAEPFKADKRKVIAIAIELDDSGKGLVDWKEV